MVSVHTLEQVSDGSAARMMISVMGTGYGPHTSVGQVVHVGCTVTGARVGVTHSYTTLVTHTVSQSASSPSVGVSTREIVPPRADDAKAISNPQYKNDLFMICRRI